MKAAYIEKTGPPENIRFGELPVPNPADSECLVRVKAVAVNPIDTYVRSGAVAMQLPFPFIVGCDLAGVVEAAGPNSRRFKPGYRVWGSNQGLFGRQGTFAEFASVADSWLHPIPSSVPEFDAAAIALVGITAHLGLFRDGKLKADEMLFVNGGARGGGSTGGPKAKAGGGPGGPTEGS